MSKKYIIIDLNQTVSRHQLEELQQEKKRDIIMGSMVFVLTAIFIWFNIINYNLSSIIEEREVRIENLNAKILNLKSEGKINLSKKDVESLYKFDAKRIFWAPKIMALTNLTPETMSITQIEFLRKKMNISAITELEDDVKEFDVVESFISKLKSSDEFFADFESIRFLNSSQDNVKGHKTFTFKIEAKLKSVSKRKKKKRS
ncbi:MAG: PilN domain-containing protein [Candidatus Marinimicrobia bacterium]|nr:PilN domain-containing protein [Candidatus Neomarinimicrobiota bacterium]MBT5956839.1 PilN domain-containing protein [Candidatus Neomarinimicrobiota bacterium]